MYLQLVSLIGDSVSGILIFSSPGLYLPNVLATSLDTCKFSSYKLCPRPETYTAILSSQSWASSSRNGNSRHIKAADPVAGSNEKE